MNGTLVVTSTAGRAQLRADRIRRLVSTVAENLASLREMVREAKAADDHVALGYASWTAYLADLFGAEPLRLARDVRQELVAELSGQGMSTRAIAPIVGVSVATVKTDARVARTGHVDAAPVVGLDGKAYARRAETGRPVAVVAERTRVSDPITSLEVAASVDLPKSQLYVLRLFSRAGRPLTDGELLGVAAEYEPEYTSQRIRSARAELTRLGMIRRVEGTFRPGPTRTRRAHVWALVTPDS